MVTIIAPHKPDAERMASITDDMRRLGAPTIRVVADGDRYIALEGSHRLAAAKALDITVTIRVMDMDDDIIDHDMDDVHSNKVSDIDNYLTDGLSWPMYTSASTLDVKAID